MAAGVELGFAEAAAAGPAGAWRLRSACFPSKVGGRPAWLGEAGLPGPAALRCGRCQQPCAFLLQLYAPLPDRPDAFHRTLFVFACRGAACYRLPGPRGPLCGEARRGGAASERGGCEGSGGEGGGGEARAAPPTAASLPQCFGTSCRGETTPTPPSRPPRSRPRASPPLRRRSGSAAVPLSAASAAAWGPASAGGAAALPTAAPSTRPWTGGGGTGGPAGSTPLEVGLFGGGGVCV